LIWAPTCAHAQSYFANEAVSPRKAATSITQASGICARGRSTSGARRDLLPAAQSSGALSSPVIWGMSAVNTDLMLQEVLSKTSAKVGQIVYWGRPMEWHNQTLASNPNPQIMSATKDVLAIADLTRLRGVPK
jgi:hypothetical protein